MKLYSRGPYGFWEVHTALDGPRLNQSNCEFHSCYTINAKCCTYYDDFGYRHKLLVDRLLSQGYKVNRLRNSFQKFYGRYPDLVAKYHLSVRDMLNASFPFNTVDLFCESFVNFRDLQDLSLGMSL